MLKTRLLHLSDKSFPPQSAGFFRTAFYGTGFELDLLLIGFSKFFLYIFEILPLANAID